jgi:hypothetical protein
MSDDGSSLKISITKNGHPIFERKGNYCLFPNADEKAEVFQELLEAIRIFGPPPSNLEMRAIVLDPDGDVLSPRKKPDLKLV